MPGEAYAIPSLRTVKMAEAAAEPLTEDELTRVLAHEMAHLVVPAPRMIRTRTLRVTGFLILCGIFATITGALTYLTIGSVDEAMPSWGWGLVGVAFGGILGYVVNKWLLARTLRRYELACDVEAAHAVGILGLSSFRFDPALHDRADERWDCTHPPTHVRVQAHVEHQNRATRMPQ